MTAKIEPPDCTLQNQTARSVVEHVWEHIATGFPEDARRLREVVHLIAPLAQEDLDEGTVGHWLSGKKTLLLQDEDDLSIGTVAHELGHALPTEDDLWEFVYDSQAPVGDWASEALADKHAVRWGLLTLEEIRQRHQRYSEWDPNLHEQPRAPWAHHGPPPGGPPMQTYGRWWRLREDFVYEPADDFEPTGDSDKGEKT